MLYCPLTKISGLFKTATQHGLWEGSENAKNSPDFRAGAADFRGWCLLLGCIKHLLPGRYAVAKKFPTQPTVCFSGSLQWRLQN